jgi:hypothetical protein
LERAQLQGANLQNASLYIKSMPSTSELVDVRGLKWRPLSAEEVVALKEKADDWGFARRYRYWKQFDNATATAGFKPPTIESCLSDKNTEITCKKTVDLGEFRERVFKELEALACQSSYIAHGILLRLTEWADRFADVYGVQAANTEKGSAREGLAVHLQDIRKKGVTKDLCPGLFSLSEGDAALLTKLAQPQQR